MGLTIVNGLFFAWQTSLGHWAPSCRRPFGSVALDFCGAAHGSLRCHVADVQMFQGDTGGDGMTRKEKGWPISTYHHSKRPCYHSKRPSYGTPMNPIGMDMIMEISLLETVGTTIWLFVTVRHGKIHHAIIKFGKPSIMGHLYHGKLLYSHNQRVYLLSLLNTAKSPCY